jgi:hypothetical protein
MNHHRSSAWLALLAAALLAGCSDKPDGGIADPPVPGVLVATLTTPHADDRAVLVEIRGAGITGVQAAATGYVVHSRAGGEQVKAAAFGTLQSGALLRFTVPGVTKSASYTARVVESSGPENALREELGGYRVELSRQP